MCVENIKIQFRCINIKVGIVVTSSGGRRKRNVTGEDYTQGLNVLFFFKWVAAASVLIILCTSMSEDFIM